MNAMVLTGLREMEMREVPDPALSGADDVLIRMARVGVCGSDVHYYRTGRIGSQVVEYPFAVGHEGAGIVERIGSGVTRVRPGDRIAIDPATPCWTCDQCLAGRPHTCRKLKFLGCPGQIEGCLSEYLVMPETSCFPIADSLSLDQAALSEPLSIGVYASGFHEPLAGARVGILGSGPIGLSVLLPCVAAGAGAIYVTDKLDRRLSAAAGAGAAWTGNPDTSDVVTELRSIVPGGLDVVFECCGEQDALDQAVELLKPGGKLVLIGIPTVDRISFPIDLLRRKELCVQNVRRQNECVQSALDMIAGGVSPDFMVTHRFAFADTREAFELVADYRDGVIKAMIEFPAA